MPVKGWRNPKGWVQYKCENCGKDTETRKTYYDRNKKHFCGRKCQCEWQAKTRIGEGNPYFNPEKVIQKRGWYKKIRINGELIYEHRYVMEQKIGRKLLPSEIVHHIDGDWSNNSSENLELCKDRKGHRRFHRRKK